MNVRFVPQSLTTFIENSENNVNIIDTSLLQRVPALALPTLARFAVSILSTTGNVYDFFFQAKAEVPTVNTVEIHRIFSKKLNKEIEKINDENFLNCVNAEMSMNIYCDYENKKFKSLSGNIVIPLTQGMEETLFSGQQNDAHFDVNHKQEVLKEVRERVQEYSTRLFDELDNRELVFNLRFEFNLNCKKIDNSSFKTQVVVQFNKGLNSVLSHTSYRRN